MQKRTRVNKKMYLQDVELCIVHNLCMPQLYLTSVMNNSKRLLKKAATESHSYPEHRPSEG